MEQARRLITLHVAALMRVVVWQQEHAVLLPLESFLRPFLASPNSCQASAFDDVDDLVCAEFHGRQCLACRDFRNSRGRNAFLTDELDKRRIALPRLPPSQFQGAQVLDIVTAVDGDILGFHPLIIGINFTPHFAICSHGFRHYFFPPHATSLLISSSKFETNYTISN